MNAQEMEYCVKYIRLVTEHELMQIMLYLNRNLNEIVAIRQSADL